MQAGKTIAAKRERLEADSERDRVRKVIRRRKLMAILAVILLAGLLLFLAFRVFQEWAKWASTRQEIIVIEKEPSVEVIDETTGKNAENLSSRVKEYIANLEEEFVALDRKIVRAHIPAGKIREVDVEVESFTGIIKVSLDRSPAVSAEDASRMLNYLEGQGIQGCEYIDVRIERKAYWK
ncbi:hypothetical protein IKG31_00300 [Candidatus Saccharibacteria bacterium]|nr:hypothetical protein [Candidatus Saccharibacteria bacterium]